MHKRNPYKPWRCASCIDKYCIHCDKIVDGPDYVLDSICCGKCSFWFHKDCAKLDVHEFDKLCNQPDHPWTCPPCKQNLCVRCNISTFHKPKTACCLCKNVYHNVCAGLPKCGSRSSDWLCSNCRPSVFPFHNIDYKTLKKLSTSCDKYSYQNMSLLSQNMSSICSVCSKKLSNSNPGIPCFSCKCKIHSKCSKLKDPKNNFHLFKGNWECENCMNEKFPFNNINDDILTEMFDYSTDKGKFSPEFSLDDKLKFFLSKSEKSNWHAFISDSEIDPNDNFAHQYDCKPNFHYYDIPDFRKTQQTWDRNGSLSLFHTNIGSLQANFNKMDDLLVDLAWDFDVIAVSETWNDVKNQTNFTPPLLDGYLPYTGVTGSSQNGGCGFYIKDNLSPTHRPDLEFKVEDKEAQSECHWLELISDSSPNTIIGVFYRHPSGQTDKFFQLLQSSLKKLKKENKRTIICGDFNLNLLNFDLDKKVNSFLCTMLEYSFHPWITEPTRITNSNKPSLVDHIFTNTFDNPVSGNILEQISYDHLPNFIILNDDKTKKLDQTLKRDKKKFNAQKFETDLFSDNLLIKLLKFQ